MSQLSNATGIDGTDPYDRAQRVAETIGRTSGKIVATAEIFYNKLGELHRSDVHKIGDAAADAMRAGAAFAEAALDMSRAATNYFQTHSRKRVARDFSRMVREHPTPALAVAVSMGFLVDRVLRSRRG